MAFVHLTPFEDGKITRYVITAECTTALGSFLRMVRPEVSSEIVQAFHDARIINKTDLLKIVGPTDSKAPLPVLSSVPETAKAAAPVKPKKEKKSPTAPAAASPAKEEKPMCEGFKKDGAPCANHAKAGSKFCGIHEPK